MKNEQKIKPPVFETDMVKVWEREIRQAQFAIKYLQKKVRKLKASRVAGLVTLFICLCASPASAVNLMPPVLPAPVVPVLSPRLQQFALESVKVVAPKPAFTSITWKWDCNYQYTNEVTLIRASTDITKPRRLWECVFAGRTNSCTLPIDGAYKFYYAENMITH